MRVIQFRQFDGNRHHLMSYSTRFNFKNEVSFRFDSSSLKNEDFVLNSRAHQLMQYTGVNDQNGKPIFEGDIVQINPAGAPSFKDVVRFNHGSFIPVAAYPSKNMLVVGNVFRNKNKRKGPEKVLEMKSHKRREFIIKNLYTGLFIATGTFSVTQVGEQEATRFESYEEAASARETLPGVLDKYEVVQVA